MNEFVFYLKSIFRYRYYYLYYLLYYINIIYYIFRLDIYIFESTKIRYKNPNPVCE